MTKLVASRNRIAPDSNRPTGMQDIADKLQWDTQTQTKLSVMPVSPGVADLLNVSIVRVSLIGVTWPADAAESADQRRI